MIIRATCLVEEYVRIRHNEMTRGKLGMSHFARGGQTLGSGVGKRRTELTALYSALDIVPDIPFPQHWPVSTDHQEENLPLMTFPRAVFL